MNSYQEDCVLDYQTRIQHLSKPASSPSYEEILDRVASEEGELLNTPAFAEAWRRTFSSPTSMS